MIIKDAPKLSSKNRFELDVDADHGCYHCIRVFKGSEITEFVDNERTALCPHCGIDSILPEVTNTKMLAECNEMWFTTVVPEDGEFDTLQKLKILETEKTIYNIHYCNAGVGILFHYPECVGMGDFKKGIIVDQYYETFEKCIAAEYALLDIDENDDDVEWDQAAWDQLEAAWKEEIKTTTKYSNEDMVISGNIDMRAPAYEYEYVRADTVAILGVEVNNKVDKRWEVDGSMVVGRRDKSDIYIQRMRREKAKG